jgi:hypothetical protein
MIKLALLAYGITATVLFALAGTGLVLASCCSLKPGTISDRSMSLIFQGTVNSCFKPQHS